MIIPNKNFYVSELPCKISTINLNKQVILEILSTVIVIWFLSLENNNNNKNDMLLLIIYSIAIRGLHEVSDLSFTCVLVTHIYRRGISEFIRLATLPTTQLEAGWTEIQAKEVWFRSLCLTTTCLTQVLYDTFAINYHNA